MKDIRNFIKYLPINSARKLELYHSIRGLFWRIKYHGDDYTKIIANRTFCTTNYYYGHEYWMKKYCGYTKFIYGMIEHGLYFGDNRSKVGFEEEWDLGSILTFGDSRIELLKELYPDYNIIGVGPRIHYADIDKRYYNELKSRIDSSSRTLALYPEHCTHDEISDYSVKKFIEKAYDLAREVKAKNILLSLHPADFAKGVDKLFEEDGKNLIIVSGGSNQINFLPRLKAIMSLADLIFTNAIGTHVGYGVYMKKPIVIDLESNMNNYTLAFEKEQKDFSSIFNGSHPLLLMQEQIDVCDHYFGYRYIKTPEDLFNEFVNCEKVYNKRFK